MLRPVACRVVASVAVLASLMLAAGRCAAQPDAVPPALLAEAHAHILAAQWSAAEACYTRVLALDPDSLEALDERGTTYDEQGQPDKARADYSRAILLKAANPRDAFYRGDAYGSLERHAEAEIDLHAALALMPRDGYEFRLRAETYSELKQYREAAGDCDTVIRADPGAALAFKIRGHAENMLRKYPEALADAEAAIRLEPSYAAAFDVRASAYQGEGKSDLAIRDANEAVRLQPGRWAVWSYRGYIYHRLKKDDLALPDFNEALRLRPGNAGLLQTRSGILFDAKQYDLAARDIDEAARQRPRRADAFLNRASGHNFFSPEMTVRDLDKAAAFTPENTRTLASSRTFALPFPSSSPSTPAAAGTPPRPVAEIPGLTLLPSRLADARAHLLAARWREAADAYTQVLVTTPDALEALAERSLACTNLGETDRAKADAARVAGLQPTSLRDYYFKAVADDALGRHDEAALNARMAEALMPRDAFDLWVRGRAHLFGENYALADADFAAVLRDEPPTAMAFVWFNRGRAGFGMKKYGSAVEAYDQALQINPKFREAHARRAEAYRAMGRQAEAEADETAARNPPAP